MPAHAPSIAITSLIVTMILSSPHASAQDRIVTLALSAPSQTSQGPIAPDRTSPNAAARYEWLGERVNRRLPILASQITRTLGKFETDNPEDTAELRRLLSIQQDWINELIQATKLPHCDFKRHIVPFPKDLPRGDPRRNNTPLSKHRHFHRILIADGLRLWAAGYRNDAAERFTAALRHSRHLIIGPSELMDSLTAAALFQGLDPFLSELTRAEILSTLSPESRRSLTTAVLQLDPEDPLGDRRIWREHRQRMLAAFEAAVAQRPIDGEAFDALTGMRGVLIGSRLHKLKLDLELIPDRARRMHELMPPLTTESIVAALARARAIDAELEAAFDAPDAAARLAAYDDEVDTDDTAVLLTVISLPTPLFKWWQDSVSLVDHLRRAVAIPAP